MKAFRSIFFILLLMPFPVFALTGDLNGNGRVNLEDAFISMGIVSGLISQYNANVDDNEGDVNNDGVIDLYETIYALKNLVANSDGSYPFTGNEDFDLTEGQEGDLLFGFHGDFLMSGNLPAKVDYSSHMPAVRSQGCTGSCTSWATGYYYKTYQEYVEEGWEINSNQYSPMYLYTMQCQKYESPWSFLRAWEILKNYGCPKWDTMPFVDLNAPRNYCGTNHPGYPVERVDYAAVSIADPVHDEAKNFRAGERSEVSNLQQLKQALTRGPVLLGITAYKRTYSNWSPSPEENYLVYDPINTGGHAILAVGYDDSKFGVGAIEFINSWGSAWADNGFCWIRYTDYNNIVKYGFTIKDLPNPNDPNQTNTKPPAPSDVNASDNAGPYVDITWSKVNTAQYYRIYRAVVGDASTYTEVGSTYNSTYRDNPTPGVTYYYSVVSFNDVGNSEHYAFDTDAKGYVDKGTAKGYEMTKPRLAWSYNDDAEIRSYFLVSSIDANATAMEVFVSTSSDGPWTSLGWINPGNFHITWGEDSEYIGKRPFVKVMMLSADGYSQSADPVQVGQTIVSPIQVATVLNINAYDDQNVIKVTWSQGTGEAEFFDVWRWLAADDGGNEWIYIGSQTASSSGYNIYTDDTALPGKNYYYAVCAVYRGAYGEYAITEEPASIPVINSNVFLYSVTYNYGELSNPVDFELNVWNDGGTTISDYKISIWVYDWTDGNSYQIFGIFNASDVAAQGQLPLSPGYEHTLVFSMNIPSAYADGHYYSWVVDVDPYDEIQEVYEDDNRIICSEGWWSYDLTQPKPNLYLNSVTYDYGNITNPVHFDLEVWNDGNASLSDYQIDIVVYDWNEDTFYDIFDTFTASDVAAYYQLPLDNGYYHILSFNKYCPSAYADGHYYSWIVDLDPNNVIAETDEEDNYIWCSEPWWSYGFRKTGDSAVKTPKEGVRKDVLAKLYRKYNSIDDISISDIARKGSAKNPIKMAPVESSGVSETDGGSDVKYIKSANNSARRMSPDEMAVSFTAPSSSNNAHVGNSRPFSKRRTIRRADPNNPYAGKIRFKKPEFCIDHHK